ncbi:hypothetical protein PISMIDRAFT_687631, partial [Pisolithus microcarpus 441]
MPPCTESLAFRSRGSTRRNLPDDIQDVTSAFVVLELFEFLCLDRVARSGSRISITFAPYLSLFRMVVLLVHIYLGEEVGIAYLGHFCAVPLVFLHGGTVCLYLPGDTSFVAARSMVGEIWVFLVYPG